VILNVFKTGINAVSFFSWVFGVFNSPVATPAHGLLELSPSLRLRFISENGSLLALYICATTHGPHFTKLLTWALSLGTWHCSYIFVPCLAFRIHVAGDLNKTISL